MYEGERQRGLKETLCEKVVLNSTKKLFGGLSGVCNELHRIRKERENFFFFSLLLARGL